MDDKKKQNQNTDADRELNTEETEQVCGGTMQDHVAITETEDLTDDTKKNV